MAIRHHFLKVESNLGADQAVVYPAGAVVNGAQTVAADGTVTVHAGHGFTSGDKYLYALNRRNVQMGTVVTGATAAATTITTDVALVVPDKALLVPLGTDTVSANSDGSWPYPNYDGSGATIYKDPNGDESYTNATIDVEPGGEINFYAADTIGAFWVVLIDANKRVLRVYESTSLLFVATRSTAAPSSPSVGMIWVKDGGAGVADVVSLYCKDSTDTYGWWTWGGPL